MKTYDRHEKVFKEYLGMYIVNTVEWKSWETTSDYILKCTFPKLGSKIYFHLYLPTNLTIFQEAMAESRCFNFGIMLRFFEQNSKIKTQNTVQAGTTVKNAEKKMAKSELQSRLG